jgi:hypothetical protein
VLTIGMKVPGKLFRRNARKKYTKNRNRPTISGRVGFTNAAHAGQNNQT